jgi:hypothetical protein
MTSLIALSTALRAHAQGIYSLEASAELLIHHRTWLRRNDFTTAFISTGRGLLTDAKLAHVDWQAAITAINTGALPCSSGEGQILRVAASLADGIPVDLRDAVTGIDTDNITLINRAILHASGRRQTQHPR